MKKMEYAFSFSVLGATSVLYLFDYVCVCVNQKMHGGKDAQKRAADPI